MKNYLTFKLMNCTNLLYTRDRYAIPRSRDFLAPFGSTPTNHKRTR